MKIKSILILTGVILLSIVGCSQKTILTKKGKSIDSILSDYHEKGKFNGSVLVVKNGKEIYNNSYGYSDGTKKTILSNDFRYGIGSIYKEFPAVLIMQLKEENKLKLEDKINKYLPELPKWSEQISILNLLQYTSGLPQIDWNKYFSEDKVVTNQAIMDDLRAIEKLEFTPGEDYIYTNNCPFLLIKIIERISKKGFVDYINEKLFIPFKLEATIIKNQYPYLDKKMMAMPFNKEFKEDAYKVKTPTILFTSTTGDLYNWVSKLNAYKIITKESLQIIAQKANLENDNMQAPLGDCSFEDDQITTHTHHGTVGNYEGLVQQYNKKDLTIVILTNRKNRNVFEISDAIYSVVNLE